jgi:hypothetical protein
VCVSRFARTEADNSSRGFNIHTVQDLNFRLSESRLCVWVCSCVCVCVSCVDRRGFFGQASHFGYLSFDPSRLVQWFPSKVYDLAIWCILFAYFFAALQLLFLFAGGCSVPIAPDFLEVRSICRFIHKRCHADAMVIETMATATGIHTILTAMSTKVEWRELSVKHCSFCNADFIRSRIGWKCRYHLRRETATTI